MRELRLALVIRMWDAYLADDNTDGNGFANLHTYACAALLCRWSRQLRQLDFQEILLFLQNLPTENFTDADIELLLSQAYVWYSQFSEAHLSGDRTMIGMD